MSNNLSLTKRIIIGKVLGLFFGFIGFIYMYYLLPEFDILFAWGILLWYTTLGAIIGVFGVFTYHPILHLPLPWWFRATLIGAWMNFVLMLFIFDEMRAILVASFSKTALLQSPFWFIVEGALIGLIIGYIATKFAGEGKETVIADQKDQKKDQQKDQH